jgi:SAM-dependent methyltransferase
MNDKHIFKLYHKIFKNNYDYFIELLKKELYECDSVLDLGCGYNSPIQFCDIKYSLGVELCDDYLKICKNRNIHNEYKKADVKEVRFESNSFDAVIALDVLEHLSKEEGIKLAKKMEIWAKKKIIIFTTNGYVWQGNIDNNPLQVHKSGWTAVELKHMNYKVFGVNGWKELRGYKTNLKYKPTYLWGPISDISQLLVYRYPRMAYQLFAVKTIK